MTVHQAIAQRDTRSQWVELRAYGRMWARYNPTTHMIEFARRDTRAVFDLRRYQSKETTLQKRKEGVE